MSKIIVELDTDDLKDPAVRDSLTASYISAMVRISEEFNPWITTSEIRLVSIRNRPTGPSFTIHFIDPLGNECSHTSDHQFIGSGGCNLSSDEIFDHFCRDLPGLISIWHTKCKEKLEAIRKLLKKSPQTRGASRV